MTPYDLLARRYICVLEARKDARSPWVVRRTQAGPMRRQSVLNARVAFGRGNVRVRRVKVKA